MLICRTDNFDVVAPERPHIDRTDGGHIKIQARRRVVDRTKLKPEVAGELMLLTMLVGEAMAKGLTSRGIEIGRINYQDNGNWGVFRPEGPTLHVHLYGRSRSATLQRFGDALFLPHRETGFYEGICALNREDVAAIRREVMELVAAGQHLRMPGVSVTLHGS